MTFDLIIKHAAFFFVGIFQDFFITYYYQSISKERSNRAALFAMLVTLINLVVLYKILTGIGNSAITIIIVYALGNGVGTWIVMHKKRIKGKIKKLKFVNSKLIAHMK